MYVYIFITKSRYRLVLEYKVMPHLRDYHDKISSIVRYIIIYRYILRILVHFIIIVSLGIVIGLFLCEDNT